MKKNIESVVRIAAAVATIVTVLVFASKRKKEEVNENELIEGEFETVED